MPLRFLYKAFKIILWSVLVWLLVRAFLFQSCRIPSESMMGTLQQGDYILINKLAYGARIPITPLSVSFGNKTWSPGFAELPYMRLPGYSKVQRNDIVAFNFPGEEQLPVDQRKKQIKRCIALPGDTLIIQQGKIKINGSDAEENEQILYRYSFSVLSDTAAIRKMKPASISVSRMEFYINKQISDSLEKTPGADLFKKQVFAPGFYRPDFYPNHPLLKWNPDNTGPLLIPQKGMSISLNDTTFILYAPLIGKHEKKKIQALNHMYFIDGQPVKEYTFTMNYYFVMGDNRYNSIDSRFWGLLPESHIIGKYSLLLFR